MIQISYDREVTSKILNVNKYQSEYFLQYIQVLKYQEKSLIFTRQRVKERAFPATAIGLHKY